MAAKATAKTKPRRRPKYRGKVADLSLELQDEVRRRIRLSQKWQTIVNYLESEGVKGVDRDNLARYKSSPAYYEWLARQEKLEAEAEETRQIMAEFKDLDTVQTLDLINRMGAVKVARVLRNISDDKLQHLDPDEIRSFAALMRTARAFTTSGLELEEHSGMREKIREEMIADLNAQEKAGAITPATAENLRAKLRLMPMK